MSDFFGTNLSFEDWDNLLSNDDFEEEPVPLEVFNRDRKYLGLPDLSPIQLEIAKYNSQIFKKETLMQLMGEEEGLKYYHQYTVNEVVAQLGKGSGKDHVSRVSMAYVVYLLHCLRDPMEYYNKSRGVYIDLVNLAVNAKQAQQVFFDPLKNLLMSSPWANEVGFEPRVQEIFWYSKPIRMFSGHSESEGWEGYEVLMVVLDEISAFKGLGPNVPVLTPGGWVKNKDIRPGDLVVGQNGKPTEVLGIFPMGQKEVFEVEFEDGSVAQCSDDHYWTVREYSDGRRKSIKTLQLKDFKSLRLKTGGKQYRYAVPVVEPVEFASSDPLPIDPYVLGVLIGDGSIKSGSVKFSTDDEFVVEELRKRLPECEVKYRSKYDYHICGGNLIQKLRYLHLWGHGAESKFIPEIYLRASVEDRKALLAGLMDSDGNVARGQGSYTTVSDELKDNIVELCRSLGGVPTASKFSSWAVTDGKKKDGRDKWMICPRVPFNPFLLPRKAEHWKPHRRTLWRSIVDVRPLGYEEDMTCIKVSNDDGLYVINDFIVTHNTDIELKGDLRNKGSASQIYAMSKASVASRFPDVGKVILLSFPRFKNDFIQEKYNKILAEDEERKKEGTQLILPYGYMGWKAWGIKAATWEVNPTKTREDFDSEFRRDPVQSAARFGCEPPAMEDAYFRDEDAVRRAFNFNDDPTDEDGKYKPWFNGSDGHSRFIHVDLGLKRDRAAIAMSHSPGFKEIRTLSGVEKLPIVNVDYVESWEAPIQGEIPLSAIRNRIVELTRKFPVVSVTFDHWQSSDMIQSLRSQGINADYHTVKKTDYDTLSTAIYDGRIRGYWNELLVEEELLKLKLMNNTKVDHPTTGTKDLADAVAGSVFKCTELLQIDLEVEVEIMADYDDYEDDDEAASKVLPEVPVVEEEHIPEELERWLFSV